MKPYLYLACSGFLLLISSFAVNAQETSVWIDQAHEDVDRLCSEEFAGRGYVANGHVRAAFFVSERFETLGLQQVVSAPGGRKNWFQPFRFSINLIENGSLTLNDKDIDLGEVFIVNKYSGAAEVEGNVVDLGYGLKERTYRKAAGKIVAFRSGWPEKIRDNQEARDELSDLADMMARIEAIAEYDPLGFIVLQPKLTHGFVRGQTPFPVLEMLEADWPRRVKHASITVESDLSNIRSQNVIGMIPGTYQPDSVVVICAHYDHLGAVGDAIFTGANDNASGMAMMLSMAAYFSQPDHRPEKSLLFIAFGAEEVGLVGSNFYVNRDPVVPLSQMNFLLNLDLMGNGVDGIMAVGGRDFPNLHQALADLNEDMEAVPVVRARSNAPNSDHYWFLQQGVKGFFIYTMGGPSHYHDVFDTAENLEFSKYVEVRMLLIAFLEEEMLTCRK